MYQKYFILTWQNWSKSCIVTIINNWFGEVVNDTAVAYIRPRSDDIVSSLFTCMFTDTVCTQQSLPLQWPALGPPACREAPHRKSCISSLWHSCDCRYILWQALPLVLHVSLGVLCLLRLQCRQISICCRNLRCSSDSWVGTCFLEFTLFLTSKTSFWRSPDAAYTLTFDTTVLFIVQQT